jgi:uncharacterized protein YqhQ
LDKKQEASKDWVPTNPNFDPAKPMQVGGQAVIEGVMMRAPGAAATAVRRMNGSIAVHYEKFRSVIEKYPWLNKPVLRGGVGLVDMMYLGIKSLNYSADVAMHDEELARPPEKKGTVRKKKKGDSSIAIWISLALALLFGVAVFFVAPLYLATHLFSLEQNAFAFNLAAGSIRIVILLGYLAAISLMKDIRRIFQYHGAEHKSVFGFELQSPLERTKIASYSRFHPRCGTSFLLIVVVVAIFSFAIVDSLLIAWLGSITLVVRLATHLPLIPVVAGLAYEFIKWSARHSTTSWGRLLIAPGLWLQRITTKEPDQDQIEVALVALRCALGLEDPSQYAFVRDHPSDAEEKK